MYGASTKMTPPSFEPITGSNGATALSSIADCPYNLKAMASPSHSAIQLGLTTQPSLPTVHSIAFAASADDDGTTTKMTLARESGTTAAATPQLGLNGLRSSALYSAVACFVNVEAQVCCAPPYPFEFSTEKEIIDGGDCRGDNVATLSGGASVKEISSIWNNGGPSSSFGSNNAIDDNPSSEWSSFGDGNDASITIQLDGPTAVSGFGIWSRAMVNSAEITSFQLVLSNSASGGQTTTTVGPFDLPSTTELYRYDVSLNGELFDTVHLDVMTSTGGNTGLRSLEVYRDNCACRGSNIATLNGGASVVDVSSIWNNGSPSSSFGSNNAIDENPSSEWSSFGDGNDASISIRLPKPTIISGFGVWSRAMVNSAEITSFQLVLSNSADSGEATTIIGPFNLPSTTEMYRYNAPSSLSGEYFDTIHLDVTTSTGGNTGLRSLEVYPDMCADALVPTPAPVGGIEIPDGGVCFSGETTIQLEGTKQPILMKNAKIGDHVLVGTNRYEPIYSFGHRDATKRADFIQFMPMELEVSPMHLIFVQDRGAIPASLVRIGDKLVSSSDPVVVEDIRLVARTGVWAPFTASGRISVNGVIASNYVALQNSPVFLLGRDIPTPFTFHWLMDSFQFPHKFWCSWLGQRDIILSNGFSKWSHVSYKIALWVMDQKPIVVGSSGLILLVILMFFRLLEFLLLWPISISVVVAAVGAFLLQRTQKQLSS